MIWCCVSMFWIKILTCWETSDFDLSKMVRTNLLKSSTMVKKYLWLCTEEIARGPQISKWSSSNLDEEWDLLRTKDNFLCLEKWQMSQVALLSQVMDGYKLFIWDSLWWERCPNLKRHMAEEGITVKVDLLEA